MNSERMWSAKGIRFNEAGNLVIDAEPYYGNRKKWEGEMEFRLRSEQMNEFLKQIEERKAEGRMVEVAAAEMTEFIENFKADYHEKKRTLAEQLSLAVHDIPTPDWYTVEKPNEAVTVSDSRY